MKEYMEKDTEGKNRLFVELNCIICNKKYQRQKRQLTEPYVCSPLCRSIHKGTRVELTCSHCEETFTRAKSKLKSSRSGEYFCSRTCKDKAQKYNTKIQPDHYGKGTTGYRLKALKEYGEVCNRCGYDENIAALVIHHKDRNRDNPSIDNLEVLCANCHAIEHWGI